MKFFLIGLSLLVTLNVFASGISCEIVSVDGESLKYTDLTMTYGEGIILWNIETKKSAEYRVDMSISDQNDIYAIESNYLKIKDLIVETSADTNGQWYGSGSLVNYNSVPMDKTLNISFMDSITEDGITVYGIISFDVFDMAMLTNCENF